MRRLPFLAVLTAVFMLGLTGVAFADAEVEIGDGGLSPKTVKADIRETIVWTNTTDADVALVGIDVKWESGPIEPGATFSIEITKKGTYEYESEDGSLAGEIVVGAAGGSATGEGDDDGDKAEKDTAKADEDENKGDKDGGGGKQDDKADKKINPNKEALPMTGIDLTLPGALSLLLIAFGVGLLFVTHPPRRVSA